jgi:dipeptide/tripeptide permease
LPVTPLDDLSHAVQAFVGAVFLAAGLLLLAVAIGPAAYAAYTHGPHVDVSMTVLFVGLATAVFGAGCIPSLLPVVAGMLSTLVGALVQLLPFAKGTPKPPEP